MQLVDEISSNYADEMEPWLSILGLSLALVALAYAARKAWQLVQRGWKDHLWIWADANRAAGYLLFFIAVQVVVRWLWHGISDYVLFLVAAGVFVTTIPYIIYTFGRLIGIWHRARARRILS